MATGETQPKTVHASSSHRRFEGIVDRVSGSKTIAVVVERIATHPKYRKQYTRNSRFLVHDENGQAKAGDRVLFEECRPISRRKRWKVVQVI